MFLHLLNNSPFEAKHSVSVPNCLGILSAWSFLSALFMFAFAKSTSELEIMYSQHLCLLSFQYTLILPFIVLYSLTVSVPFLKYLIMLGYMGVMCWTAFRCYYQALRPDILQMGVLALILVVMDCGQAVMLAQEINQGVEIDQGVVERHHLMGRCWVHLTNN